MFLDFARIGCQDLSKVGVNDDEPDNRCLLGVAPGRLANQMLRDFSKSDSLIDRPTSAQDCDPNAIRTPGETIPNGQSRMLVHWGWD